MKPGKVSIKHCLVLLFLSSHSMCYRIYCFYDMSVYNFQHIVKFAWTSKAKMDLKTVKPDKRNTENFSDFNLTEELITYIQLCTVQSSD